MIELLRSNSTVCLFPSSASTKVTVKVVWWAASPTFSSSSWTESSQWELKPHTQNCSFSSFTWMFCLLQKSRLSGSVQRPGGEAAADCADRRPHVCHLREDHCCYFQSHGPESENEALRATVRMVNCTFQQIRPWCAVSNACRSLKHVRIRVLRPDTQNQGITLTPLICANVPSFCLFP